MSDLTSHVEGETAPFEHSMGCNRLKWKNISILVGHDWFGVRTLGIDTHFTKLDASPSTVKYGCSDLKLNEPLYIFLGLKQTLSL